MSTKSRFNAQVQEVYESTNFETMGRWSSLQWRDDFMGPGSQVIPAAGAAENGCDWVKKIVGAAPPTVAAIANAIGGQIALTLTSTSEKQDAALYWDDKKAIDVTKGAIFEGRFNLGVLPSIAGVQAVFGLASSWIDGPDNNTCYLQVGANGSGALLVRSYDGVTTISAATGITVLTTDWVNVRIDATDVTDVKVLINGVQVTTAGQINFKATGSLAVLQPYAAMYKASGTGVGTMNVDFVKIWANRA